MRADDLAAQVIAELVRRNPTLDPARVTDVMLGCANQAGEDNRNVARMALLLAGLPRHVPGETVNRLCASGMSAVANAARAVKVGDGDFYIAGGVESMTRAPYVMSKGSKPFARDIELFDTSLGWRFVNPTMKAKYGIDSMGQTAENVAEQYRRVARRSGSRSRCARSRRRPRRGTPGASTAKSSPFRFRRRKGEPKCFDADEFIRPDTTLEILAQAQAGVSRRGRFGDGGELIGAERRRGRAARRVGDGRQGARRHAAGAHRRERGRRRRAADHGHGSGAVVTHRRSRAPDCRSSRWT